MSAWSRTPYRNPQAYSFTHLDQPAYAYLSCAPGCQGSKNNPRFCTCVCQGINHGIAWTRQEPRPVPVPYGYNPNIPLAQLPELTPRLEGPQESEKPVTIVSSIPRSAGVKRKIGRSFVRAMTGHVSEEAKNTEIMTGLRKQFSQERVDAIVTEAFAEYFSHDPDQNTPELYELFENDTIDNVLARRNIRWVLGRPKKK